MNGPLNMGRRAPRPRARGAVAIMVAVSLVALVGMAGLALDGGRLYVNKAELQTAADACALAAAQELVCKPVPGVACPASYLANAEAAGKTAAARNSANLQAATATIASADVRFSLTLSPNSGYLPRASADTGSRYVMCIARTTGIAPWLMGVLNSGSKNVDATAVASLIPSQDFCSAAPMGICKSATGTAPNYGYTPGQWITANFTANGNGDTSLSGSFRWVDFSGGGGGNTVVRDQLYGRSQKCNISIGDNVASPGTQQASKQAYNTRFGLYANGANAETVQTAPPDRTGYAYPNKAPGSPVINVGTSAYSDYRARQSARTPFTSNQYSGTAAGNPASLADLTTYGSERRLVPVAIIDCNAGNTTPILSMGCALMLNPMANGASGSLYLEYIGNASAAGSPCRSFGSPGSPAGAGPLVPSLVQ